MSEEMKQPTRRWDVDKYGDDYERTDGMYVLYTDHVAELNARDARIAELEERIRTLEVYAWGQR